jgi:hypothetical protein
MTYPSKISSAKSHSALSERVSRALATSFEEQTTSILLKAGASSIEWNAKRDRILQVFKNKKNSVKFISDIDEPVPFSANYLLPNENKFDRPDTIDVAAVAADRVIELKALVDGAFQPELDAIPAAPEAGWTAEQIHTVRRQLTSDRSKARLGCDLQLDSLKKQQFDMEQARLRDLKDFDGSFEACGDLFLELFDPAILAPHMQWLNSGFYRRVWRAIQSAYDGSLGGTTNTMALIDELRSYTYCHDHPMEQNIAYLDRAGDLCTFSDEFKMVTLTQGIERSTHCHKKIREIAAHHLLAESTYRKTCSSLLACYSQLLNAGIITQNTKKQSTSLAEESLHLQEKAFQSGVNSVHGGGRGGRGRGRGRGAGRGDGGGRDGGRGGALGKRGGDTRGACHYCGKLGHHQHQCFKKNPCTICGSDRHGDWNHSKSAGADAPLTEQAMPDSGGGGAAAPKLSQVFEQFHKGKR